MNGNQRGEDEESNYQCLGNRAYIRLWGILILQKTISKIEIDGELLSVERETSEEIINIKGKPGKVKW